MKKVSLFVGILTKNIVFPHLDIILFILFIQAIVTCTYSKINLDIVLSCFNIQTNNQYNISIQFSIQYQYCSDKNVKNLVLKIRNNDV